MQSTLQHVFYANVFEYIEVLILDSSRDDLLYKSKNILPRGLRVCFCFFVLLMMLFSVRGISLNVGTSLCKILLKPNLVQLACSLPRQLVFQQLDEMQVPRKHTPSSPPKVAPSCFFIIHLSFSQKDS